MYEYTATIQEHGDHVLYSSKLDVLSIDRLIPVVTNEFGWSFKDWLEKRRLGILSTTKNYWFAGVNGSSLSTLDDYKTALAKASNYGVFLPDLNKIRAFLKRNNVNSGLTVVVPPEVTSLLFSLKKTADGENYSFVEINNALKRELIFKGQVGEYFGFNFVESNAIESYTYTYETSKTATFADCYILGKVNNSWGASEIKLEGEGFPEMIHKTPGSAGALDPYNMLGSIAWKTYYGGTLVYEEAVMKYTVKLDSPTFSMFDDANRGNVIKEAHFDAANQKTAFADLDATNAKTVHGVTTTNATKSNNKKVSYPADDGSGYTPVTNS